MNSIRKFATAWLLMNTVFTLLVLTTGTAMADTGTDIDSIINALPASWGNWATGVVIVLYAIAHLRSVLPESLTNRIPAVVMKLLDVVSANYGNAKNASHAPDKVEQDITDTKFRVAVESARNQGKLRGNRIENAGNHPGDDGPGNKSR